MRKLFGFIVAILVVVPSVAVAVPIRLDNQGVGLEYMIEPVDGSYQVTSLSSTPSQTFCAISTGCSGEGTDHLAFADGGNYFYLSASDTFARFSMSSPYDFNSTITQDQTNINLESFVYGLDFTNNGDSMYINNSNGSSISSYSLSSPYSIVSTDVTQEETVDFETLTPTSDNLRGLEVLTNNGTNYVYMVALSNHKLYQFEWSQGSPLSTVTLSDTVDVSSNLEDFARSIFTRPDGSSLYIIDSDQTEVEQYDLSTPYQISSLAHVTTKTFNPDNSNGSIFYGEWNKINGSSLILTFGDPFIEKFPIQ